MPVARNSEVVGTPVVNKFDDDTIFALEIAMEYHDAAASDPVTAPAAFGVACTFLQEMLKVNLRAAALLLDVALTARSKH
jgi:hypothetical protein